MAGDGKIVSFFHQPLDGLDAGVAKLEDLIGLLANHMVVLPIAVRLFVERQVLSKLVLGYEPAIQKQVQGVVHRGSTHPIILVFHIDIERFHIEMAGIAVYFLQYGKAFGRFAQALLFQVIFEYPLDLF